MLKKPASDDDDEPSLKNMKRPTAEPAEPEEETGDSSNVEEKQMDSLKSKKFNAMWDDIPEAIRTMYTDAGKLKNGKREAKRDIVNAFLTKDGTRWKTHPDVPIFIEAVYHTKVKQMFKGAEGVPRGVAMRMYGSETNLLAAIAEGEVTETASDSGGRMILLPKMKVGEMERAGQTNTSNRAKPISTEYHDKLKMCCRR